MARATFSKQSTLAWRCAGEPSLISTTTMYASPTVSILNGNGLHARSLAAPLPHSLFENSSSLEEVLSWNCANAESMMHQRSCSNSTTPNEPKRSEMGVKFSRSKLSTAASSLSGLAHATSRLFMAARDSAAFIIDACRPNKNFRAPVLGIMSNHTRITSSCCCTHRIDSCHKCRRFELNRRSEMVEHSRKVAWIPISVHTGSPRKKHNV
mmetsp:Transcript_37003/g.70945  ORF Transcript_37003/g.70945 Transcript_37003/m.70945 type:complete len:210 (-) Transcript_37003:501-1130(-)